MLIASKMDGNKVKNMVLFLSFYFILNLSQYIIQSMYKSVFKMCFKSINIKLKSNFVFIPTQSWLPVLRKYHILSC